MTVTKFTYSRRLSFSGFFTVCLRKSGLLPTSFRKSSTRVDLTKIFSLTVLCTTLFCTVLYCLAPVVASNESENKIASSDSRNVTSSNQRTSSKPSDNKSATSFDKSAKTVESVSSSTEKGAPSSDAVFRKKMDLLHFQDADGTRHTIKTTADWEKHRGVLLQYFEQFAGPFPYQAARVPLEIKVLEEVVEKDYIRRKISFVTEPNDRCLAWLLVPRDTGKKYPAIICPHPTHKLGKDDPIGLTRRANRNYAQELTQRGYVTISPDYWPFGEKQSDPYKLGYQSATMKGIWNTSRCVDLLQSLPYVEADRIGIVGHSLGGHNAIFAALFEPRIKAVATSCGFTSFHKYYDGKLAGWSQDCYMPLFRTRFNNDPNRVPSDFNQILALIAPRPIFVNAPKQDDNFNFSGVLDCIRSAKKIYALYGRENEIVLCAPDCEHDFPPKERAAAYEFFDKHLKKTTH